MVQLDTNWTEKKRTDFPCKPAVKRFLLGKDKNSIFKVATVPRL